MEVFFVCFFKEEQLFQQKIYGKSMLAGFGVVKECICFFSIVRKLVICLKNQKSGNSLCKHFLRDSGR